MTSQGICPGCFLGVCVCQVWTYHGQQSVVSLHTHFWCSRWFQAALQGVGICCLQVGQMASGARGPAHPPSWGSAGSERGLLGRGVACMQEATWWLIHCITLLQLPFGHGMQLTWPPSPSFARELGTLEACVGEGLWQQWNHQDHASSSCFFTLP